jgi:hypothetical protein
MRAGATRHGEWHRDGGAIDRFFGRFSDFLRFTEWGANRVAEGGV